MTRFANASLIAAAIAYMVVVGSDIFGQQVLIPVTFAEPPRSLLLYNGPVEYDSAPYWQTLTTIVTALAALAIVTNWKTARRWWVVGFFAAFFALNALSFAFVFPEYEAIQNTPYGDYVDPELVARAEAQEVRAAFRSIVALAIAVIPLHALTLPLNREA